MTRLLRLVLAGLLAAGCAGTTRPAASPADSFSVAETEMLAFGRDVVRSSGRASSAWPGFWRPGTEFILYSPEITLLFSPHPPPRGWVRAASDEERMHVYRSPGPIAGLVGGYVVSFPLEGRTMPAVDPAQAIGSGSDPGLIRFSYLFHEAFHGYQNRIFARSANGWAAAEEPVLRVEWLATPEFRARFEIERTLLAAALETRSDTELRSALRDYAAVRTGRFKALPALARDVEAHLERKEGSAHWVGYQAALLADSTQPPDALKELLAGDLTRGAWPNDPAAMQQYHRSNLYATGAALGVLLSRLGVDWQPAVQNGRGFFDLVQEAAGPAPSEIAELDADVLERHGFEQRRARFAEGADAALPSIADFENADRPRLILTGFAPGQTEASGRDYSPELGVAIYPRAESITMTGPTGELRLRNVPVMEDRRQALSIVVLLPRDLPAGVEEGGRRRNSFFVETGEVTLRITVPVEVERIGRTLRIQIR